MTLETNELHEALVLALNDSVLDHSDLLAKPLDLDIGPPVHAAVRCYVYNLVEGGASRPNEYKAVLRVPGHPVGEYRSFERAPSRITLVVAYRDDLDVWVMWDATLHPRFKNGGNIQVRRGAVLDAAVSGYSLQERRVRGGYTETILLARSRQLPDLFRRRLLLAVGEDP